MLGSSEKLIRCTQIIIIGFTFIFIIALVIVLIVVITRINVEHESMKRRVLDCILNPSCHRMQGSFKCATKETKDHKGIDTEDVANVMELKQIKLKKKV